MSDVIIICETADFASRGIIETLHTHDLHMPARQIALPVSPARIQQCFAWTPINKQYCKARLGTKGKPVMPVQVQGGTSAQAAAQAAAQTISTAVATAIASATTKVTTSG